MALTTSKGSWTTKQKHLVLRRHRDEKEKCAHLGVNYVFLQDTA